MPPSDVDVQIAKLEERLCRQKENSDRNERDIEHTYEKIDQVDGKVERLTGRFDAVDNKIDTLGQNIAEKIDTLSGIVIETKHSLDRHILDSTEKEIRAAKETTALTTKQKTYYGIAILILGALASGIISIVVHFVQKGV